MLVQQNKNPDAPKWVSTAEMSRRLGVHVQTLRALVAAGKVPHLRVGKNLRFDPQAVASALRGA